MEQFTFVFIFNFINYFNLLLFFLNGVFMDKERVLQFFKTAFVKCIQALIPVLEVLIMDFLNII